ncbi:helix-turn-helix transcriptional regulator [Cellulosimicrobium sp. Marseille-Q4280]|uniref:helix-turn-helix transcriptional regulator n=1 Tax=Cellulosimicrobium sp. Marseille-Q4280 TaxID=2937992 RepID=UPI002557D9F7|nr:helix-turn-helix transcriptional regulator [Cellulosimicrobium sp. Marseille-Q4280]
MPRPSTRAPFVARADELERLAAAVDRARRGEPGVVLVGADAGVGKTRLLTRATELAAEQGATVVWSHCVDLGEVGLPYLPFTEALTTLRSVHDAVDETVAQRPALARLLDAALPADDEQSQGERLQLFESIAAALAASGTPDAPLVLVVEDLHWADPSSRDVLRFVVARLRSEHVVVVASYRSDDLHRRHPLRPVLAELRRHPRVEHVDLRPFTAGELRDFTTAVAGDPLREDAFESVRTRSEGNAYFAEELVEAGPGEELPWSLADVLRARLETLDPPVQHLVRTASVSGRQVSERLLRAVLDQDGAFAADPGAFDRSLREAIAHHVLGIEADPSGDGRDTVVFRHALLAEAVATDLLPGERVTVHRTYLRALSEDPTLGSPALRAHHALAAHDLPAALTASRGAARKAARVLAPAEELRHLEQVLSLWAAVPDAAERLGEDRVAVALAAAGAASRAGSPERAVALARKVVEATADDPLRQAALRHVLSRYLLGTEQVEEVLTHTAAALAVLPTEPPSLDRAWTLAMRARAAMNADQDELAAEVAAEALAEAHRVDAPDVEADVLTTMAVLEVEDEDRAAVLLEQARERAVEAGDILTELRCWYNIAANRYYAGHLTEALDVVRDGVDRALATGLGWSVYGVELRLFDDLVRYAIGDLTPTDTLGETVPESWVPTLAAVQLYAAVARGDADAVERGTALRRDWYRDGMIALISGGCSIDALTWAGRYEEAVELAVELVEHLGRTWSDYFLGRIWLSALALAALADAADAARVTGDTSAAVAGLVARGRPLLDAAVTTAERGRPRGGTLGPEGRAWLARAAAEHARLTGETDAALWEETTRAFDYGYRYEAARSRFRWAEALCATGDRNAAEIEAAQALEEAEAMGAAPLAEAVRSLARRARLDLPGLRRSTATVLTDREEEVLILVAQGLTNRQIGERLYISAKTVSVHISNVLAKLGASGRAEAVSLAHQRGLLEV